MRSQKGFTIIELMIAISVVGILVAAALPSFDTMLKSNCMTTATNSLITSLQGARSEAVKTKARVNITALRPTDNDNEWGTGWTVWRDLDADGTMDANEPVRGGVVTLTCEQPAGGVNRMTVNETNNLDQVTYLPTGFILNTTHNPRATFRVCHDDQTGERGRQIDISTTGRPATNTSYTCP